MTTSRHGGGHIVCLVPYGFVAPQVYDVLEKVLIEKAKAEDYLKARLFCGSICTSKATEKPHPQLHGMGSG